MNEFNRNWDYSQQHINNMIEILKANSMNLISVEIADEYKDTKESTDLIINVKGGDVAVRTRKQNVKYRDLTIRSRSKFGNETELDKIKKGFAKWYLYAWENGIDYDYIIVDMDIVRDNGLLDIQRNEMFNFDGTKFISIPVTELEFHNCLVAKKL